MIYLLFVLLIMITINAFLLTGRDILSPFVIVCGMFTLSTFFAVLMTPLWNLQLSAITVIVIVLGIIMFGFGEYTVRWVHENKWSYRSAYKEIDKKEISIPLGKTILVSICLLILVIIYFQKIYEISLIAGNDKGYLGMLEYARIVMIQQGINPGLLLNQIFRVSTCIAYLYVFVILYKRIYLGEKKVGFFNFLPIILYLFLALLSTSRTYFTQIAIYTLIVGFLFYYKKGNKISVKNMKIIKIGVTSAFIFFAFFSILGFTTGKTQNLGVFNTISYYLGGSISALDNYLNNPPASSGYFGSETLYIFYNTLNMLGFDVPTFPLPLESIQGANKSSNVYTALRRYLQDYGFLGMMLIQYILGLLYALAYLSVKNSKKYGLNIIFYAAFFYPVVEIAIEERVFSDILSLATVIKILSFYLFYKILIDAKIKSQ